MTTVSVLVTDDELVGWMSERAGREYAPVLPTVDVTSAEALTGAAMRGIRSTAVREDADGVVVSANLDALLLDGADSAPVLLMNIDLSDPQNFRGAAVAFLRRGDAAVIDLVEHTGVHRLWSASVAEVITFVEDSVARVVANSTGPTSLVLFTGLAGEYETFAADGDGVHPARVRVDGDGVPAFAVRSGAVVVPEVLRAMLGQAWSRQF